MRILFFSVSIVILSIANIWSAAPKDRYVVPIKNDIPVFAHDPKSGPEQPSFIAGTGDRLMVLGVKSDAYKVSDLKGDVGWIDKVSVKEIGLTETMTFGNADVLGFLDNPTPIYILDASDSLNNIIMLTRSFSNELKENIDRMTIDRIVGEIPVQW
jgi:hypothetical protein